MVIAHTQAKDQVKDQSVHKTEWKQTDEQENGWNRLRNLPRYFGG